MNMIHYALMTRRAKGAKIWKSSYVSRRESPGLGLVIGALFFASGATGLIYEVVWTRFFTIAYGNTTYGVSAALTAFMAGLGLGSYIFGRIIDRKQDHLLIYAILEAGIAVLALAMPWIFSLLQGFYSTVYNGFPSSIWMLQVVRTIFSFAVLAVPTCLMGGTLPVLTRFFVTRKSQVGTRVGLLYAANTLGATIGCFLTGFMFIKIFGLKQTVYITAVGNLLLAAAFLFLRHRLGAQQVEEQETKTRPAGLNEHKSRNSALGSGRVKLLLVCFALAGFTSLAYEILWFRLLVFHLQTTIYAFTTMLTTFLAGIGLGSAVFAVIQKRGGIITRSWEYFGFVEAAIGLLGLLSIIMFGSLESINTFDVRPFWQNVTIQFTAAAIIMILPTLLMGAAFPIVCKTLSEDVRTIGGSVGTVYAANTVGAILGSFLTGFFLVRTLGTQNSILVMGFLNLIIASVVLMSAPGNRDSTAPNSGKQPERRNNALFRRVNMGIVAGIWIIGILSVVTIPRDFLFQYYNVREKRHDSRVEILHAEEGLESITAVHRYPDMTRVITAGSINVAGTSFTLRTTQMLQGHIPMLLHPHARDVVQIGFGSGETAHIITTYDNVESYDLVEISQSVLDTSSKYFTDINHDVVHHKKFNPIVMDGANYLRLTRKKYDVIMNDSIWPFYAGNSGLYTRDYFQAGKEHLKEGGIMTSWLPLQIAPEDFNILINTFHSVFPHVTVWVATTHFNVHALLVGSEKKVTIDARDFLKRFDRYARKDLEVIKLDDPYNFLGSFKMDETGFGGAVRNSAIHTENDPILEFSLSRLSDKNMINSIQLRVHEFIHAHMTSVLPYFSNHNGERDFLNKLRSASEASGHMMMGFIKRERFDRDFIAEFKEALRLWPKSPGVRQMFASVQRTPINPGSLIGKSVEDLASAGYELIKNGDFENACRFFEQIAKLRPKDPKVHNQLGQILFNLKRFEDALEEFKTALSLESTPARVLDLHKAHILYAIFLDGKGSLDKAARHFVEAIRLAPAVAEAHSNYGILLMKQDRTQEAISQFNEAIRLEPENVHAHFQLGVLLGRNGNMDVAVKHLVKVVEIQPVNWVAHRYLAYAYYYRKDYKNAWKEVHKIQGANQGNLIEPGFLKALESESSKAN